MSWSTSKPANTTSRSGRVRGQTPSCPERPLSLARLARYRRSVPRPLRVHVANGVFHVTQRATDHEILFVDATDFDAFDRATGARGEARQLEAPRPLPDDESRASSDSDTGADTAARHAVPRCAVRRRSSTCATAGEERSSRADTSRGSSRRRVTSSNCLQYFACNPVTAGLCERPEDWPWSSWDGPVRPIDKLLRATWGLFGVVTRHVPLGRDGSWPRHVSRGRVLSRRRYSGRKNSMWPHASHT